MQDVRLPRRISAIVLGMLAALALTVALSVRWLTDEFDREGARQAMKLVETAVEMVRERTELLALDHSKWTTAVEALSGGDIGWIYENMGVGAHYGEALNILALFDGPLDAPLIWADWDIREDPRPDLLPPELLDLMREAIAGVPGHTAGVVSGFFRHEGELFVGAVARVEPLDRGGDPDLEGEPAATLLIARRIDAAVIAEIEAGTLLPAVVVRLRLPAGSAAIPLRGFDGAPVSYLGWEQPRPGTAALAVVAPPLLGVGGLVAALVLVGLIGTRRAAKTLVAAEQQARAASRTDLLTGLANRVAFTEVIGQPARPGERVILFLDINGFKRINDSLGHAVGDDLIQGIAERLSALVRPDCFLARIGGDEFVFVVTGFDAERRAVWLARTILDLCRPAFAIGGHVLSVRAAVGYAVQPDEPCSGEDLVRRADLAMYEAKRRMAEEPVAYSDDIEMSRREDRRIEAALRAALTRPGEISIAYQPIVSLSGDDGLVRAEALARWTSPELGPVPPDRFIRVAEESGLILDLGRHLIDLVLADLEATPDLAVCVNVSPLQLAAPNFIPDLIASLGRRGIAPARLCVELTEGVIVSDPVQAAMRLAELRAAGFATALDDFGIGYSSIGYLIEMPFGDLKIDRSFTAALDISPEREAMLAAMIRLGHCCGLRVVCEGVETEDQLSILRRLGCDLVQGYLLARPMPLEQLRREWIARPGPTPETQGDRAAQAVVV